MLFPYFFFISRCLHKIVRVEAEDIMIVSLWPTQPCIAVKRDCRCAKDTSTATEHDKILRKEHEVRLLMKRMLLTAFRLSGNPLKRREYLRGLGTSSYIQIECGTFKQYSSYITKHVTFCGSLQIDCSKPDFLVELFNNGIGCVV